MTPNYSPSLGTLQTGLGRKTVGKRIEVGLVAMARPGKPESRDFNRGRIARSSVEVIMLLKIQRVVEYIHANLDEKITADHLARAARLSRSRLCSLFKAEMGVAPMQYLRRCRIEKARDLLVTTSLSLKEIRASVGLSDRSHFTRGFKETFGVAPLEYRRRSSDLPTDADYNGPMSRIIGHIQ